MSNLNTLKSTAAIVKEILERHPETRDSDNYLYLHVCKSIDPDAYRAPFCDIMMNRIGRTLPPFESVRRTRQKLQRDFPHLASSRAIMAARSDNEQEFRAFAREVNAG